MALALGEPSSFNSCCPNPEAESPGVRSNLLEDALFTNLDRSGVRAAFTCKVTPKSNLALT